MNELPLPKAKQQGLPLHISIINGFHAVFLRNISDPVRAVLNADLILYMLDALASKHLAVMLLGLIVTLDVVTFKDFSQVTAKK